MGARVAFSLFFDDRFALENTWSVLTSRVAREDVSGQPPAAWIFGRLGYGLSLEGTAYAHRIPANDGVDPGRVPSGRTEAVLSLVFGW